MEFDGMTREQAVIWAAGFLDGEGTIRLENRPKFGAVMLEVQAVQVNPVPLLRLKALWGGSISLQKMKPPFADAYHWNVKGRSAIAICAELLPYLTVKRRHAELAIEFGAVPSAAGKRISPANHAEREVFRQMFSTLNKRGVSKPMADIGRPRAQRPQLRLISEVS